jgi:ATP-dependent Zn protease
MSVTDNFQKGQKEAVDTLQSRIDSLQSLLNDKNENDTAAIYELTQEIKREKERMLQLQKEKNKLQFEKNDKFLQQLASFQEQINDPNTIKNLMPPGMGEPIPTEKSNTITWVIIGGIVLLVIIIIFALYMVSKKPKYPNLMPQMMKMYQMRKRMMENEE